jgi:predicted oxidoreductase
MKQIQLNKEVNISNVVHGVWRLSEWGLNDAQIIQLVEQCRELGIDTFDHADIYGNYMCEELFGNALKQAPELNKSIKVVSKCGIKLLSSNRPSHYIKHYDTSYEHIIWSADNSLKKLQRDNLDVLLLHRPDPFINPEEVARAFDQLKAQGKVKAFGVSNFLPSQFNALQSYLDFKLVTNQIEISVAALHEFDNGTIDHCQEHRIHPMAWSPLAGGAIFTAETHRFLTIRNVLHKIGKQYDASIDQIMYAWLLAHPVGIVPIIGSGKIERIKAAVEAQHITLTRQQWFELWTASKGQTVP